MDDKRGAGRKRRVGRPTQDQTAELTALVLDAAEASLIRRGFQNTTIQLLAEDIGVTRRSIVARFPTKDDLLIAVALRDMEVYAPQLASVEIREEHFRENLDALVRKLWERGSDRKQAALLRTCMGEAVRLPELPRQISGFYHQILSALEQKIVAMQRYGMFRNYKASTVAASAISLVIANPRIRTILFDPAFDDPVQVEGYSTDAWMLIREMA